MQTNIQADASVTAAVNGLLVELEGVGVSAVALFTDGRLDGLQHWGAYLGIDGQRHFLDTKSCCHLGLEQQAAMLLEKLRQFIRDRGSVCSGGS
jgi:hypothetical protein